MPNNVNTITVAAQETAELTIAAILQATATALNWEYDADNSTIWDTSAHNLGIEMRVNNAIYFHVLLTTDAAETNGQSFATYVAGGVYKINYLYSENNTVLAIGIRQELQTLYFNIVFAVDENNGKYGLLLNASNVCTMARGSSVFNTISFPMNTAATICTSILKMPSMFNACMFSELFIVASSLITSIDVVFYIGGKYYRVCAFSTAGTHLAIPI